MALPIAPGRVAIAAITLTLLVSQSTLAVEAPRGAHNPAPDVDARHQSVVASALADQQSLQSSASTAQTAALADFEQAVPDLRVRWSALTGAPSRLYSTRGALTGPSSLDPPVRALGFVSDRRALFNLTTADLAGLQVARNIASSATGASYVTLQQQVDGIEVFGGRLKFVISPAGEVRSVSGEPIAEALLFTNSNIPALTLDEATAIAASAAGVENIESSLDKGLVWFPVNAGELRLARNLIVLDEDSPNAYRTLVDAADGRILWRRNLTHYAHQTAIGRVHTSDGPDPGSPAGTASGNDPGDNTTAEGEVPRQVVPFTGEEFFPHDDDHADWWNGSGEADYSRTVSNNVTARDDRLGNNAVIVTTDASGDFTVSPDFDLDVNMAPDTYINASVANLFYWYNRLHDFWYGFGFDEDSGNAQVDNFGLGGMDGDPIIVDAQDNSQPDDDDPNDEGDFCNAFMNAMDDGDSPRSKFLICDRGGPVFVDAGLDNTVVAHEFGHLVVGRLMEGAIGISQGSGMNEGFSDLFGLTILAEPGDDVDAPYGIGGWYGGNPNSSIRREFYSTDPTVFTRRYEDIAEDAFCRIKVCSNDDTMMCTEDSDCGDGNSCDTASCGFQFQCEPPVTTISQGPCRSQEHKTGEMWANTLWIAYANMFKKFGYAATRTTFHQLVVDGLKGAPDDPDFLDMRDAILLADLDFQGGATQCLLWDAFARMGMGVSAVSGGTLDINVVQAFDTPPECTPNIDVNLTPNFGEVCLEDDTAIPLQIFNTGTGDLIVNSITFEGTDADEFSLDPTPGLPVVIAEGAHVDFTIRHVADSPAGTKNAQVVIGSNDPDDPVVTLPITGEVGTPDLNVAIANAGHFGNVCVGDHADLDLTLFNQGSCDLTISNISKSGLTQGFYDLPDDLQLPLVLGPGSDFTLPVRYAPPICTSGTHLAQVDITSDSPGESPLAVELSGTSTCPELVIDPAGLEGLYGFPATVVDTTGTLGCFTERSAVLRNAGECPLNITDISAAGPDFQVVAPTVFPILLPGGEETLEATVRFAPQSDADPLAPGELTDVLTVTVDNNGVDPTHEANLCGESAQQSGVRILVTDVSSGLPVIVDEVDSLKISSKGKNTPSPVNLSFTDLPPSSTDVCGNTVHYHVNLETLPSTDTAKGNGKSSYQAVAKEGNLQANDSFSLDQCEFRDAQLQLKDSDSPACLLLPKGASCDLDSECCSGKCKGPASGKTCK